jgi:hypothetical protein
MVPCDSVASGRDSFATLAGLFRSITGSRTGVPMADVNDVLAANRVAVLDLVAAAERLAPTWITPCAPGKWSPSQVVEHLEEGRVSEGVEGPQGDGPYERTGHAG